MGICYCYCLRPELQSKVLREQSQAVNIWEFTAAVVFVHTDQLSVKLVVRLEEKKVLKL